MLVKNLISITAMVGMTLVPAFAFSTVIPHSWWVAYGLVGEAETAVDQPADLSAELGGALHEVLLQRIVQAALAQATDAQRAELESWLSAAYTGPYRPRQLSRTSSNKPSNFRPAWDSERSLMRTQSGDVSSSWVRRPSGIGGRPGRSVGRQTASLAPAAVARSVAVVSFAPSARWANYALSIDRAAQLAASFSLDKTALAASFASVLNGLTGAMVSAAVAEVTPTVSEKSADTLPFTTSEDLVVVSEPPAAVLLIIGLLAACRLRQRQGGRAH